MSILSFLHGLVGIAVILGIAYLFSNNKRKVSWRVVGMGLLIQIVFGMLVIKGADMGETFSPLGWPKQFFGWLAEGFVIVLGFTTEGARFVFGSLAVGQGFEGSLGFFFAFQVLPTIIFFSSLMSSISVSSSSRSSCDLRNSFRAALNLLAVIISSSSAISKE